MVRRHALLAADQLAASAGNLEIHGTITVQSGGYPMVASAERAQSVELNEENWCRLRDLNPRPTIYKAPIWSAVGLYFKHLQRLPAPSPGPPRHNYGTPNLGSAHSRHRDVRIGRNLISPPVFSC